MWWSDFCEEERLFLGGLQLFNFTSIRNVPKKLNFRKYIETMTIFDQMLKGADADIRRVTEKDAKCLKKMVDAEISSASGADSTSFVDPYIVTLFHHFVESTHTICIDLGMANAEVLGDDDDYFGFKPFRSMWFGDKDDNNSIDIGAFLKLFKHLKTFTIWEEWGDFKDSISINGTFMQYLVDIVKFVESDKFLRRTMDAIFIVKPVVEAKSGLQDVVRKYGGYYTEYGWGLEVEWKYAHPLDSETVAPAICLQKNK